MGAFKGMLETFYNSCVNAFTFGLFDLKDGGWNKDWDLVLFIFQT